MVSLRCKLTVISVLNELGLSHGIVELGEVLVDEELSAKELSRIRTILMKSGLELMDNKKAILIEKVKNIVIELVHYSDKPLAVNLSGYLSEKLGHDYHYLSHLFSEATGTTIEQFVIAHRVERIKELLLYDELNVAQIAEKMNYSSVAHLSNQFKKATGLAPSFFKKMRQFKKRIALENV